MAAAFPTNFLHFRMGTVTAKWELRGFVYTCGDEKVYASDWNNGSISFFSDSGKRYGCGYVVCEGTSDGLAHYYSSERKLIFKAKVSGSNSTIFYNDLVFAWVQHNWTGHHNEFHFKVNEETLTSLQEEHQAKQNRPPSPRPVIYTPPQRVTTEAHRRVKPIKRVYTPLKNSTTVNYTSIFNTAPPPQPVVIFDQNTAGPSDKASTSLESTPLLIERRLAQENTRTSRTKVSNKPSNFGWNDPLNKADDETTIYVGEGKTKQELWSELSENVENIHMKSKYQYKSRIYYRFYLCFTDKINLKLVKFFAKKIHNGELPQPDSVPFKSTIISGNVIIAYSFNDDVQPQFIRIDEIATQRSCCVIM